MDLEVGVLQRQRGIGRHTAGRVAIARNAGNSARPGC